MTTRNATDGGHASDGIVIAGGGLAGQRCAETLRRAGYEGAIRIVCAEPHRPYDRPPLSKAAADRTPARDADLAYRAAEWYDEQSVDLLLGVSATGLYTDRAPGGALGRSQRCATQQLLIATGGRPRTLPVLARLRQRVGAAHARRRAGSARRARGAAHDWR